jgi:uncharacterized protein (DUF433 family)
MANNKAPEKKKPSALVVGSNGPRPTNRRYRGITRTPGVCGGDSCIKGTRLPVWVLLQARSAGVPDAELLERYPYITLTDLKNVWRYAQDHMAELEDTISKNSMW